MKTNIYSVTGNNGQSYEDYDKDTVVVEAPNIHEATVKGAEKLRERGCHQDVQATLEFENVTMKKPKPPEPKCKHCGKSNPL